MALQRKLSALLGSYYEDKLQADGQPCAASQANKASQSARCWVEKVFLKRECNTFIASPRDGSRCCCGRGAIKHRAKRLIEEGLYFDVPHPNEKWHPYRHTDAMPTDAFGIIEFQGAAHPSKAQYVRLSSLDTKPEHVLQLLQKECSLELPKLLITVHGGISNFDLQPKLKRVFRKGLLKAAKTTGSWIFTGGTNTGVTRYVGDAISDRSSKAENQVIAVGIAPWGVVDGRDALIGMDVTVPYHCVSCPKTNGAVLNSSHSYFLLADNGTIGKYGGEIIFRRKLEKFISQQTISTTSGIPGRAVPVICVVLEGGANTIRSVLEYVTDSPPVPVVVFDGSGRASDLLAFTHQYTSEDGTMAESLRDQLILTIQRTFQYSLAQAEKLFMELMLCVKKKELITVFRMSEGVQDIDLAILTALLRGTNASAPDQLTLALMWDRVDIARSHIFVYGQEWPEGSLEQAMMDALILDRVDFVKLLLENGVSMHSFLTVPRLEELYNTRQGPSNTLRYLVRDVRKHVPSHNPYTLLDIGLLIQQLMGGAFRATYCRRHFRQKYYTAKYSQGSGKAVYAESNWQELFPYPFHDFMIWAVLMKRQKMALFMWQHGEEAMAKSLMACRLYKAMAHEADQDDLEIDVSEELHSYAKEFQNLALEVLEHCYRVDDDYTQQLLTYELKNFSDQTCLSLAVAANHRTFIAHSGCQILLTDMWMGGLRMRRNTSLKVILGIILPPYVLALEFKSKEELQLMPQTTEEHWDELDDSDYESDRISVSSISNEQTDFGEEVDDPVLVSENRLSSTKDDTDSFINEDVSQLSSHPFKKKKSPLRLDKKIYEFYNAPITKFWVHTMAYVAFLGVYTYVVLIKTQPELRVQEYVVIAYVITAATEILHEIIASEPTQLQTKLRVYFSEIWNIWDVSAILIFFIAVSLRLHGSTVNAARVLYSIDIVFWYIRILEIFSVNKYLGLYVKIIGKLVVDMLYYLLILLIVLMSFGIVRQSIHFPNEEPSWHIVRNMFFYPYWMIYGELFADDIDPCEEEDTCVYGSWVAPTFMTMYLLVANILMVNLLIARFNATFLRNNAISREIWKFQRYHLIIAYEMKPILPPPLITINHIYLTYKYIRRRCKGKRDNFDNGLKLFLSAVDTEKLHDFEEECIESYFRDKDNRFQTSSDERIRNTNEKVDNMLLRQEDMNQKETSIKLSLQNIEYRMSKLEEMTIHTADTVRLIHEAVRATGGLTAVSREVVASNMSLSGASSTSAEQVPVAPYAGHDTDSEHVNSDDNVTDTRIDETVTEDQVDRGDVTMKSRASPLVVHSKKPLTEKRLKMFTDYSKPYVSRHPIFSRSHSCSHKGVSGVQIPAVTSSRNWRGSDSDMVRSSSSRHSQTSKGSSDRSRQSSEENGQLPRVIVKSRKLRDRRRHASDQIKLHIPIKSAKLDVCESIVEQSHTQSSLCDGVLYSTAHIATDTSVSTIQQPAYDGQLPAGVDYVLENGAGDSDNDSAAVINISPEEPGKQLLSSDDNSSVFQRDILTPIYSPNPILLSLHQEYSSITDDIDTSCLTETISPHGSPLSPTTGSIPQTAALSENGVTHPDLEPVSTAWQKEEALLKKAEESECRNMERVIHKRLRQISLNESDSIGDLARLVVSEMNFTEESPLEEDDNELLPFCN